MCIYTLAPHQCRICLVGLSTGRYPPPRTSISTRGGRHGRRADDPAVRLRFLPDYPAHPFGAYPILHPTLISLFVYCVHSNYRLTCYPQPSHPRLNSCVPVRLSIFRLDFQAAYLNIPVSSVEHHHIGSTTPCACSCVDWNTQ